MSSQDASWITCPHSPQAKHMDLLSTRIGRRVLFSALDMSEGAPIGFLWWTLPAKLRAAGMDLGAIPQLTAVLVLPWVFKFLWSPAVDIFRARRWGLRSWILAMQFIMGVSLIPLAVWDLSTSLPPVSSRASPKNESPPSGDPCIAKFA